jgi:hypothetical protein
VISPVLANLFLHYAFDMWMVKNHPDKPFARYADDAVAHCYTKQGAEMLPESLKLRMAKCKLGTPPGQDPSQDDAPGHEDTPERILQLVDQTKPAQETG